MPSGRLPLEIYAPDVAETSSVFKGQTYILIHSGSRGFGHQICQDTLDLFLKRGFAKGLPDKQPVIAPTQSETKKSYFGAMAAAANFAFNNRQQILAGVWAAFHEVLRVDPRVKSAFFRRLPQYCQVRRVCVRREKTEALRPLKGG